MSDNYTNSYKSTIDSLQLSTPIRQMLKTASMNLDAIKPSMLPPEMFKFASTGLGSIKSPVLPPEVFKFASMGLDAVKPPKLPPEMFKPTFMELSAIKQSMFPPEMFKFASMELGSVKSPILPPELLKTTSMGIGAIKQSMLPPEAFKAALGLSPSLTKLLGTDQIAKFATTGLGNSMSPYIKKTLDISGVFDSTPSISEAIKLNVKAASAWNNISKIMDSKSLSDIMSDNLRNDAFNSHSVNQHSDDQTSHLKIKETISENKYGHPRQTTSNTDIGSENLVDENVELMEYLNKSAIDMFNDGFSLPAIASTLISWALTFTNVLTKVKDSTDAYIWLGRILIDIYVVLKLLG